MKKTTFKKLGTFADTKAKWLKDPRFKKAYDELALEYSLIELLINLRNEKKLTQAELAEMIGTHQSAIARFESGNYNPSLIFVQKLAKALGAKIKVEAR